MAEPTVVQALAAVADDVREVRKNEQNKHGGYNFRGIDAVLNAVGPALRRHGVVVMPTTLDLNQSTVQTTSGKPQTSSKVLVRYTFYGPEGDSIAAEVYGEAWDSSDKGLAQAYSVAYRTCLLQALSIPTDDPDPDSKHPQRAVEPSITPLQKGEITAAIASLNAAAKDELQGWWKDNNLPSLKSGALTERQAAVILERLNDLTTGGGVGSQPEAASDADRENTEGDAVGETNAVTAGQSPEGTQPPGTPAAARAALERSKK